MKFLAATSHAHATPDRTAVLMVNLGTPAAPTRAAVHAYLEEFLLDPRVVEVPRVIWWPLLKGAILPFRSGASAERYAAIWTHEGSPLLANSERQQRSLMAELQKRGIEVDLALAMRYGQPSVPMVLEGLRRSKVARLLVVPMYPQYSATTTGSAFDAISRVLEQTRNLPELRWIRSYADDPGYIDALRRSVRMHWDAHGRGNRLVMSFHGLPRRNLDLGDPYHCECVKTGRLLAESLDLQSEEFAITFQSRFGRARWLEPYTVDVLRKFAREKVGRVDVICPGFTADCLETLEEIAIDGRRVFLTEGGREFHTIACLNDSPRFISALADLIERHAHGWPVLAEDARERQAKAQDSFSRARAMGAGR
jgi:ferrochelatase